MPSSPGRTSPSHTFSARETTSDASQTEFDLKLLEPYNGRIRNEDLDSSQAPVAFTIEIPTLRSLGKIGNHSDIHARRADALLKGSSAIHKGFLVTGLKASRRLHSSVFPKELELLTRTLTTLERVFIPRISSYGYRVSKDAYLLLLHVLWSLRATAADYCEKMG
ncbi:hypothetical protein DFH06DRAFT_1327986 [Mycena polygramma]|nr:hypothetical protein DFH06DRAFT_1327986 [Mycena polygramma]